MHECLHAIFPHWAVNPGLSLNPGTETSEGFQNYISIGGTKERPGSISCFHAADQPSRTKAESSKHLPELSFTLQTSLSPFMLHLVASGPALGSEWQQTQVELGVSWEAKELWRSKGSSAPAATESVGVKGHVRSVQAQKQHISGVTTSGANET